MLSCVEHEKSFITSWLESYLFIILNSGFLLNDVANFTLTSFSGRLILYGAVIYLNIIVLMNQVT